MGVSSKTLHVHWIKSLKGGEEEKAINLLMHLLVLNVIGLQTREEQVCVLGVQMLSNAEFHH